ncbi:MAG TPA: lipopolysaccharide biosynthesis protein [Candidatus Sulfotelmatobacter sp.]|nr:lipopolysaccharide biosynthesis protein [Candidatus Sulfotelmatobacter sp.]
MVNVALARTQTKEDYGTFALSYSIFMFLSGLHSAMVLEPFTVYGSGRYQGAFGRYWKLMMRGNVLVGFALSVVLFLASRLFLQFAPSLNSPSLVGLALTIPFILSGSFLRRSFYVVRKPNLAARTSLAFCLTVGLLLWISTQSHRLNGFSAFVILAVGWLVAGMTIVRDLPFGKNTSFLESEPRYWREHWVYSRWVLAQAFVYQFMHQGYYWLVAGFLSVKEVGELKAMYVLIAPIEQVMISLSFLFLPALAAEYAGQNTATFRSVWRRYALLELAITVAFALAMRMVGAPVIHILYAGKFDDLAPMLFLLALVPLTMALGNAMSDAIRAVEKPRLVFYSAVGSALATFLIGVPLVKYFGLHGAVYGMLVSGAAFTSVLAVAFWLHVHKPSRLKLANIYTPAPPFPTSELS